MFVGPLAPMQGIIYDDDDDDHNGLDGLVIQSKAMDLAAIRLEGFQYNHSSEVYRETHYLKGELYDAIC